MARIRIVKAASRLSRTPTRESLSRTPPCSPTPNIDNSVCPATPYKNIPAKLRFDIVKRAPKQLFAEPTPLSIECTSCSRMVHTDLVSCWQCEDMRCEAWFCDECGHDMFFQRKTPDVHYHDLKYYPRALDMIPEESSSGDSTPALFHESDSDEFEGADMRHEDLFARFAASEALAQAQALVNILYTRIADL